MTTPSVYENLCANLRGAVHPVSAERSQAAVLMAVTDADEPQLLLIRRSLNMPSHPGEIALPGGKVDPDDKDLLATALREAWEEVALPATAFRYCGSLAPRTSMLGLAVTAVVGVVPAALPLRAHIAEVDEILYVPLRFFAEAVNLRVDRVTRGGVQRLAPRFQYAQYTIWGITAGFIVELVNRLYGVELHVAQRSEQWLSGVEK